MIDDITQAEDTLAKIADYEAQIKAAEQQRDALILHYERKIADAQKICVDDTTFARQEIASLTEDLRRFAEIAITGKKRSIKLPSGILGFRKQSPKFFFDDLKEANARDQRLIHFVKHHAYDFLKVKVEEYVDWAKFKTKLDTDGDNVFYVDTGEIVEGLHAQFLPDTFTVDLK